MATDWTSRLGGMREIASAPPTAAETNYRGPGGLGPDRPFYPSIETWKLPLDDMPVLGKVIGPAGIIYDVMKHPDTQTIVYVPSVGARRPAM